MSNQVLSKKNLKSPTFTMKNKILRVLWAFLYIFFFRLSPTPFFRYRNLLLRCFGAKVKPNSRVYPSVKIWFPPNLILGNYSTLGPNVELYNQGNITICDNVIISQGAYLCASTHDYNDPIHPLILSSIHINNDVWVCAEAFVCPGINLAKGTVIGARSVITKSTDEWSVYAGNPARKVNTRKRFYNGI